MVYRIRNDGMLKTLKRWPIELASSPSKSARAAEREELVVAIKAMERGVEIDAAQRSTVLKAIFKTIDLCDRLERDYERLIQERPSAKG